MRLALPFLFILSILLSLNTSAQTIATFTSVTPTEQTQNLVLPSTHRFQRLIKSGDALSFGGTLGNNLDFTGYVPVSGSSTNGYLSISSETYPAECAVLSLSLNSSSRLWNVNSGGKVLFPAADIGEVGAFCSGTITPRNTVMVCEEMAPVYESNGDGYEDLGWIIEIDPVTRTVINQDGSGGVDKLWAMGRQRHENVAIKSDETAAYWGADDGTNGFMYKFVPTVAGNFSAGALYVLQTTSGFGTGTWQLIANTTQADRNNTVSLSLAAGAYNFNRIEDVEIGPDGKIYMATTTSGHVLRFRDLGTAVDQLEIFVASASYDVDGAGPLMPEPWGAGADNMAFDGEGNLWVLQDGTRNHIWVVGSSHTTGTPNVRLFATTPAGSEPTGITFSPDYKYLFMSFQHPSAGNATSQLDVAGNNVVFNTSTTVVIARSENLGPGSVLPAGFLLFNAIYKGAVVELEWATDKMENHSYFDVERSEEGINFSPVKRILKQQGPFNHLFSYTDANPPSAGPVFYRIRQCDNNGACTYSEIKKVASQKKEGQLKLHPVPASSSLKLEFIAGASGRAKWKIVSKSGMEIESKNVWVNKGKNVIAINTALLVPGTYVLIVNEGGKQSTAVFSKISK